MGKHVNKYKPSILAAKCSKTWLHSKTIPLREQRHMLRLHQRGWTLEQISQLYPDTHPAHIGSLIKMGIPWVDVADEKRRCPNCGRKILTEKCIACCVETGELL